MSRLCDLVADVRRLAVVGLAKNTGKTRTLAALLEELEKRGRIIGVTSIGRDGEDRDVLDPTIIKPRVSMPPGGLVCTAEPLLRDVEHSLLTRTGIRTPLGHIVIARIPFGGTVEVAGPSSSADTAEVSAAMLDLGVDNVLIDGAINRRSSASPDVADAVVLATGAVLHRSMTEVVARTVAAVDLMRLPQAVEPLVHQVARETPGSVAVLGSGELVPLDRSVTLGLAPDRISALFTQSSGVRYLVLKGALCQSLAEQVRRAAHLRRRPVSLVVQDGSKVFLSTRTCGWFRRQGVSTEVLRPIRLTAVSVNPVAPNSHRFDSARLRKDIEVALPALHVCDVVYGDT